MHPMASATAIQGKAEGDFCRTALWLRLRRLIRRCNDGAISFAGPLPLNCGFMGKAAQFLTALDDVAALDRLSSHTVLAEFDSSRCAVLGYSHGGRAVAQQLAHTLIGGGRQSDIGADLCLQRL